MEKEIMETRGSGEVPKVEGSIEGHDFAGAKLEQMKEKLRYTLQSKVMKRMAENAIYKKERKERTLSDEEYDEWSMKEWDEKGYSTLFGSFINSAEARELMQKYADNDKKLVDILARIFENTEMVEEENEKPYRAFKRPYGTISTLN